MAADPRVLFPAGVIVTEYVICWLTYTSVGEMVAVKEEDEEACTSNKTFAENASAISSMIVRVLCVFLVA